LVARGPARPEKPAGDASRPPVLLFRKRGFSRKSGNGWLEAATAVSMRAAGGFRAIHAAAGCEHQGGSRLHAVQGLRRICPLLSVTLD